MGTATLPKNHLNKHMFVTITYKITRPLSKHFYQTAFLGLLIGLSDVVNAKSTPHPLFAPERIQLSNEKTPLNPTGCTMQDMVDFYKTELNIKHKNIIFLRRRMEDPNRYGYTRPGKGKYIVTLAKGLEPSELRIITAHELVHVRQFVEGSITIKVFKKEVKKDYLERSFEDEAFRLSEPLAIKFYQTMNCKQKSLD